MTSQRACLSAWVARCHLYLPPALTCSVLMTVLHLFFGKESSLEVVSLLVARCAVLCYAALSRQWLQCGGKGGRRSPKWLSLSWWVPLTTGECTGRCHRNLPRQTAQHQMTFLLTPAHQTLSTSLCDLGRLFSWHAQCVTLLCPSHACICNAFAVVRSHKLRGQGCSLSLAICILKPCNTVKALLCFAKVTPTITAQASSHTRMDNDSSFVLAELLQL